MKKFFVKLIGWREQRSDPKKFHQAEKIEKDIAKEHVKESEEHRREKLKEDLDKKREEPSTKDILGPSEPTNV